MVTKISHVLQISVLVFDLTVLILRISHQSCSIKISVLKHFAKFTGRRVPELLF